MEKEWDIVEVLRHSRHDWLNRLQIIKGNLDLNRTDRAKKVIDQIVIEAQNETKLSNMKIPHFASLLLKSNWENPMFQLDFEVYQGSERPVISDEVLSNWTNAFFACLNKSIDALHENHLSITIESQIIGVRFIFDFNGIIVNRELMEEFLSGPSAAIDLTVKELSDSSLSLEIMMPVI